MTPGCYKVVQRAKLSDRLAHFLMGGATAPRTFVVGGTTMTVSPPQNLAALIRRASDDVLDQARGGACLMVGEWMLANGMTADRLHRV